MKLSDYPRPERDNGRGMHWSAGIYHPTELDQWIAILRRMNIRWLKVLDDGGGTSLRLCGKLLDNGIFPIVRLYRLTPNPGHIGDAEEKTLRALARLGVRYIEMNNEPDLVVEWKNASRPQNWLDIVAENWLYDAGKCLDAGALPAVPALSVGHKDDLIRAIVEKGGRDALVAGSWVAIHNYCLNHPLDYPDDDVNQRGTPLTPADYAAEGTWAWDNMPMELINTWRWQDKNPGATINDDMSCFRSFEFVNHQVTRALGFSLPIITTEGGVVMGWREDRRYPRISPRLHQERTVAMFAYMQTAAPPYYFAMCPWLLANYALGHYDPGWENQSWFTGWWDSQFGLSGRLPTVDAVIAMPTVSRSEMQGAHHSVIQGDVVAMRGIASLRVALRSEGFGETKVTDAQGRFHFGGLGPGTYTLQAGGLIKAGLQLDGTNTLTLAGLRPPLPVTPALDWDRRLSEIHISLVPAEASEGSKIWKLVRAYLLDRTQTGVARAVYFDVLDQLGRPVSGQEVILKWPTGMGRKSTEAYEPPAHGADFPLSGTFDPSAGAGPYSAWVDGLPSDTVTGLGVPQNQDVAFVLVFQRAVASGAAGSTIEGTVSIDQSSLAADVRASKTPANIPVTLHLPDARTRTTQTDQQGHYAFANLAPGSYSIEIAQHGIAGRNLVLDGTNIVILDYILPSQMSTLRGSVVGGQWGLDVHLRSQSGAERHTTLDEQAQYGFRLLPAGAYSVTVSGQTVKGIMLDGENTVIIPPIDVRPRTCRITGHVRDSGRRPLAKTAVTLTGPDGPESSQRETLTDGDGAYAFRELLAGIYTVRVGQVSQRVEVDVESPAVADLVIPIEKVLPLAILLGPPEAMGTRVNLRLTQRYIRTFAPTVTFRAEEAERARQVLIVGDLQAVSAADEDRLRASNCLVARIGGTPYAVEDALARLVAANTPMPRSRAASLRTTK